MRDGPDPEMPTRWTCPYGSDRDSALGQPLFADTMGLAALTISRRWRSTGSLYGALNILPQHQCVILIRLA